MEEQIARPTEYGAIPGSVGVIAIWFYFLVAQGWRAAAQGLPLLLLALGMVYWTLFPRLRFCPLSFALSIGPWTRRVDLTALESIRWKQTGGWRSPGMIFLSDRSGHQMPVYFSRFNRADEWAPMLLDAVARTGATVDSESRMLLEERSGRQPKK